MDRAGMFCFSLMLPFGYEGELLAWQYNHQALRGQKWARASSKLGPRRSMFMTFHDFSWFS